MTVLGAILTLLLCRPRALTAHRPRPKAVYEGVAAGYERETN